MKKTHHLVFISLASIILGISITSASENLFVTNSQGEMLPLLAISVNTGVDAYNVIKDGDENDTKNRNDEKSEMNRNASSSSNKDDKEGGDFEIDGDRERSDDTRGFLISHMAQVHSGLDLKSYVQFLVHQNKDIKEVITQEDSVLVSRRMDAKLFWLIPMSVTETVEVVSWGDGTKQVLVSRPWWDIFSKNQVGKGVIFSSVESKMNAMPISAFKTTLDPVTKALIISEIQAVFAEHGFATSTRQ